MSSNNHENKPYVPHTRRFPCGYYISCSQCSRADGGTAYTSVELKAMREKWRLDGWTSDHRRTGANLLCPTCAAEYLPEYVI